MHALAPLLDAVQKDPVFAYCLLAATLLAVVSVVTGLLYLDIAVLFRPRSLLRVVIAIVAAFALWLLGALLQGQLGVGPATTLVAGLSRFPLYLVALAYGPLVGLVTGALFAGLQAAGGLLGWNEAMLALELAVLGWLAIFPSPRSSRWAGPFNAVLAYVLAWGTGGLALLDSATGAVTPASLWAQQQHAVPGVAVSAALLVVASPAVYARLFPGSRIAPPPAAGHVATATADGERSVRDPMKLTYPELPRALGHGRRRRELEPFPEFPRDDDD
jgi:hypothetical protein